MYEPRTYREQYNRDRFSFFQIALKETDLWIGLGKEFPILPHLNKLRKKIGMLREEIEARVQSDPEFAKSHLPVSPHANDSDLIRAMKEDSSKAGVGPMATVAGVIARETGVFLSEINPESEIVVENGGDIFMKINNKIILSPFSPASASFRNISIIIPGEEEIISVCSSSGQFGHSFSYGKADLVTVLGKNTCLCDAWATSIANCIKDEQDLSEISEILPDGLDAVMAITGKKVWYKGKFPLTRV